MTSLHPNMVVDLGDGESPMSFCSRSALLLGRTARDFSRDIRLRFQDIVDGDVPTLEALALCCRADADELKAFSLVKLAQQRHSLRGQLLTRDTVGRKTLRVCPHCLLEDIDTRQGLVSVRPYGRTTWLITPIRTCAKHEIALVDVVPDNGSRQIHDFAHLVNLSIPSLERLAASSSPLRPSGFEKHLARRIAGHVDHAHWLQSLPFYAAAKVCEVLGAIATLGIRYSSKMLSNIDWHSTGATGFEIAASGEPGIRSLLVRLQEAFPSGRHDWGPRFVFGRLYEWLAHDSPDAAYQPLRDIIRRHVIETMPVGPGDDIFGQNVEVRRLHSVRSASVETGAHAKRLRKLLTKAGHIKVNTPALTDERTVFDAEKARGFLERISETMSLTQAGRYINAPRVQANLLFEASFIEPFIFDDTQHGFAKRDLDAFLQRLLSGANHAGPADHSLVTIPEAAKRAKCPTMTLVALIMDKKLSRVRRQTGVAGYLSILVDPEEVKPLVKGPEVRGLRLRDVEQQLHTSGTVVKALISDGHLATDEIVNPVNRCPQRVVQEKTLAEFVEKFASLHTLARQHGTREKNLRVRFDSLNLDPAFVLQELDMPFYDREVVAKRFGVPDSP
ncbi:MAG: TniQ family protein [Afipia sp.]|nr:TniQ family protein [Afipia sp.]